MELTAQEEIELRLALKHTNQGISNNQTFNDSTHGQSNLESTGSSEVFVEEEKENAEESIPNNP